MNTQTLTQRRAIHKYVETQGAIYHAERKPEPVQMCAVVEDAPVAPWIVWTLRVALSLLLAFIAYGLGLAVRP